MKSYTFYFDESFHDKKIRINENGQFNILREDSLDNYIGNSEDKTFLDSIEDEDSNVEKVIIAKALKSSIDEIISSLDPRESEIIIKRYGFDGGQPQTLEELGESMGVSRERVRQLENRALEKLKKKALKKKLNDYLN